VIIPALNEEGNLKPTVIEVVHATKDLIGEYELLIFNDGSDDRTGAIADKLASQYPQARVIHNSTRMGLGYSYTKGVELARYEYVIMIPGDNEIRGDSIRAMFSRIGEADIVITYIVNPGIRPWHRRLLSKTFVGLMNGIFGLHLRYYNGTCIHKSSLIKSIPMETHGFAYMASILVRLLKRGCSYVEVGMELQPRNYGRSKAFSLSNMISVLVTITKLFLDVRRNAPSGAGG
jgi:glycosyltransferase involved in cell wall biosynthesis